MAKAKIQFWVSEEILEQLQALKGAPEETNVDVMKNALSLYKLVKEEIAKGSLVLIEDKSGNKRRVIL